MKKFATAAATALTVGLLAAAAPASAAVIFSDNFSRADNNTVGNGWLEQQFSPNQIRIDDNRVELAAGDASNPDGILSRTISTLGYTNIKLAYEWDHDSDTEDSDTMIVQWRLNGGSWNTLATHEGDENGTPDDESFNLAAANGSLEIRFVVNMSQTDEEFRLDDVVVTGDLRAETAVPEPMTLGLFGSALVGLGLLRRRKKA